MISFTSQEKAAILFFVVTVFAGSCASFAQKHNPHWKRWLTCPMDKILRPKVYINSATQEQWESLPAVGAYRASQIIKAREDQGRFRSVEDVRYVKGIGPYVFNQIRPYLYED